MKPITLYTDIKEKCLYLTKTEETLTMASQQFVHVWIDFKTKKEISWKSFVGECASRAYVPYVPTGLTWIRALRAHVRYVPASLYSIHAFIFLRALRAFIFIRALHAFIFYVAYVISLFYVPYVTSFFTCLRYPHFFVPGVPSFFDMPFFPYSFFLRLTKPK